MPLYKTLYKAGSSFPSWFLTRANKLIKKILYPNPHTDLILDSCFGLNCAIYVSSEACSWDSGAVGLICFLSSCEDFTYSTKSNQRSTTSRWTRIEGMCKRLCHRVSMFSASSSSEMVQLLSWWYVSWWSSPSETTRVGDSDFSPSSPQRHALLLLLAGIMRRELCCWQRLHHFNK